MAYSLYKKVKVWYNSDPMSFVDTNLGTKEFIIKWYTNTIKEYIKYKKSWGYE